MANGEFISERKSDFYVRAVWSAAADTAANASVVTVQVYVGYYSVEIGSRTCTCTIGASTQSAAVGAISHSGSHKETLAGTFTARIAHASDGSGAVAISAGFPFNLTTSSQGYIGTLTAAGTAVLDPIPRAAQVSAGDMVLGNSLDVRFTPASPSHSFSLRLSLGDWSETVAIAPGSTAPYPYREALPFDAVAQNIVCDPPVGQMTAVLTTYAGDQVLGTTRDTFSVTVPENDLTTPTLSVAVAADTAQGDFFLQGKSRAQVIYMAEGKLGASIVSCVSTVEKSTFTELSPVLTQPGNQKIVSYVTDSRGFTTKKETEINVYAYGAPYVEVGLCERRGSDGASFDPAGTSLYLQAQAVATALPETVLINDVTLQWRMDGGDWQTLATDDNNVFSGVLEGVTLALDKAYRVELRAYDAVDTGQPVVAEIPTAYAVFHLRKGGGAAFGKYGEEANVLDIAGDWSLRSRGDSVTFGDAEPGRGFTCAMDMDMKAHRITGLAAPQADTDAVSKKSLLELVYPVGSLYLSYSVQNPAQFFGGTWERITETFLWAASDAEEIGSYRDVCTDETGMTLPAIAIAVWQRTA